MAGQVGGQQVSREELRARGRYSLTIACLFLLILVGAGLGLPRRAIVVVPIVVAIVVSVREMRRLSRASAGAFTRFGPAVALRRDGSLVDDFLVQTGPRQVHVLNAPSPAATASLEIADHLVTQVDAVTR